MREAQTSKATKVVVATTVMLAFISFWRAAAIVLCDLASSAYYAGGLAEGFIGKSAPWFVLAIMVFLICERINKRGAAGRQPELEKFRLVTQETVAEESVNARPGNVLVAIRNPNQLDHLEKVLIRTDTRKIDIVVLTVKRYSSQGSGG